MSTRSRIEMESHKDPQTLEREIDLKRAEIGGTVAALERKLSPGELFERALGFARGNGREFFDNLATSVKANPVPMVLTSVGLLWMMASQHSGSTLASGYDAEASTSHGLRDKAGELRARASGKLGSARERVGSSAHHASESLHHAGDALRQRAGDVRQGFDDMMREQPLAIGAMGIALGALVGAMLPPTRREDELLGSASERARTKAKELASSGLDSANERLASHGANGQGRHRSDGGSASSSASQPPF